MSETLREIAIDFARRLAACEANRAFSGLDAWEHGGEYLAEYMERINAADQERTCRMDDMVTGERADYECWEHVMHCCACHYEFGLVQFNENGDVWMNNAPSFCPHCGAKVVSK